MLLLFLNVITITKFQSQDFCFFFTLLSMVSGSEFSLNKHLMLFRKGDRSQGQVDFMFYVEF
jgi:hypothetical protein